MANPHFIERKACPACGTDPTDVLYRCAYTEPPIRHMLEARFADQGAVDLSMLEGADYVLAECPSCTLIFQRFVPDEFLADVVSEQWHDPDRALNQRGRAVLVRGHYALEILGVLDHLGRERQPLRFLDFGMGWGRWVQMAEAFGVETYGVEPLGSRTELATGHHLKVLNPSEIRNMRFDFINSEQVFEHIPNPVELAAQLGEVLEPGGIFKISVPNGMRVKRRLRAGDWLAPYGSRNSLNDVFPLQHINAFNHRALIRLGERAGLVPVRIPARLRYRYAPVWERPSRLLKRTVGAHYRALRGQTTVVWFRRQGG